VGMFYVAYLEPHLNSHSFVCRPLKLMLAGSVLDLLGGMGDLLLDRDAFVPE